MENTDVKLTWEKIWKQGWSEWDLKNIIPLLEERLKEIIKPKDLVTDYDKAEWESSVIHVIYQLLPLRYFIRIIEEENNFVFQFVDSSRIQESQSIKVPYRKVFDWGVETWDDALQLHNQDRRELYSKWKNEGYSDSQIARHFGLKNSNSIHAWAKCDSWDSALTKTRKRFSETTTGPVIARVRHILKTNGVDSIIRNVFIDVYRQITGDTITCNSLISTNMRTISPDIPKCLDIAIRYTEEIVEKIKEINSSSLTSRSIGQFVSGLSRSSKIKNTPKKVYDPISGKTKSVVNHKELEKILDFYTNVLNNLKQMKGELK